MDCFGLSPILSLKIGCNIRIIMLDRKTSFLLYMDKSRFSWINAEKWRLKNDLFFIPALCSPDIKNERGNCFHLSSFEGSNMAQFNG